jgi:hypothetical protein
MSREADLVKSGRLSENALAQAKAKRVAQVVDSTTFKSKADADKFLSEHKAGGGLGYIDPYASDRIGWEVRHWRP